MSILKNSLIYKIVSGFFVACRHSRIGMGIGSAFKGSNFYNLFFKENNKMIDYASHSKFLGNRKSPKTFSVDQSKKEKTPKYLSWFLSSFFMKMIITWKDCEHDDQYT